MHERRSCVRSVLPSTAKLAESWIFVIDFPVSFMRILKLLCVELCHAFLFKATFTETDKKIILYFLFMIESC